MPSDRDFLLVNGRRFFDVRSQKWIAFDTPTDALFTQLAHRHELPYSTLTGILHTLRNPSFNSSQLTLRHPTDIDTRISEQRRREIEEIYANAPSGGLDKVGMPLTILRLVVELIADEMGSFASNVEAMPSPADDTDLYCYNRLQKTLCQMALVHRSWTPIVQKVLDKRAIVPNLDSLRSFVQSAACTAQLRELRVATEQNRAHIRDRAYDGNPFYGSEYNTDKKNKTYQDYPLLLASVFVRTQSITSLHLSLSLTPSAITDNNLCLKALTYLQSVENLWLVMDTSRSSHELGIHNFRGLCRTIARLSKLRMLSLDASSGREAFEVGLEALSPPNTLKTLVLPRTHSINRLYIDWLVRPRGGYALSSLSIGMFGSEPDTYSACRIASRLEPCVATLRNFFVEFTSGAYASGAQNVGPSIAALNGEIFQRAHSLERIYICFRYPTTIPAIIIPRSTRSLHIHLRQDSDGSLWYGRIPKSFESKTEALESLYPSVCHGEEVPDAFKEVFVTYGKDVGGRRKEAMEQTDEAQKAKSMLESKKVKLDVRPMSYGDLKETFYKLA